MSGVAMNAIELLLDFATKAAAENALDYYENQPGYQSGSVLIPRPGETCWRVRILFAADIGPMLSDRCIMSALGVLHVERAHATAG